MFLKLIVFISMIAAMSGASVEQPTSEGPVQQNVSPRRQSNNFCLRMKPGSKTASLRVDRARLTSGKWVEDTVDFKEVDSPESKNYTDKTLYEICASGKEKPNTEVAGVMIIEYFNSQNLSFGKLTVLFHDPLSGSPLYRAHVHEMVEESLSYTSREDKVRKILYVDFTEK